MLNVFRSNNPSKDVPEADPYKRPTPEEIFGGMDDINKAYLPPNPHIWDEFLENIKFSDDK